MMLFLLEQIRTLHYLFDQSQKTTDRAWHTTESHCRIRNY